MISRVQLQVLGVGNAFTAKYFNTCFLIRSESLWLIDGAQGLMALLRSIGTKPELIEGAIVTHVHGDHTSGLESLILWKRYAQRRRLKLWTTRRVYLELEARFLPRFSQSFTADCSQIVERPFEEYVDFCELRESEATLVDGRFAVEVRYNWHPALTLGLKICAGSGSVGISGDTCYRPDLLQSLLMEGALDESRYERLAGSWLWDADVIYHEADRAEVTCHTREKELLGLPETVRRKLRLIHYPDDFEEKDLPLARQGEFVDFSSGSGPIVQTASTS